MSTVLITGASGFLGRRLCHQLSQHGSYQVYGSYCRRADVTVPGVALDLREPDKLAASLEALRPDIVIHTAYSKIPEEMYRVITNGTAFLARRFRGCRFIHISTDYVFNGFHGPYGENDLPQPHTLYGKAKYAAELAVQTYCDNFVIVRTSLISGTAPLPDRWLAEEAKLRRGERVIFYSNEIRNPVHVDDLAAGIVAAAESDYQGIIHIAGPRWLSRYEELELFVRWRKLPLELIGSGISDGKTRPLNCSLKIGLFQSRFGLPLRAPEEYWQTEAPG